MAPFQPRIIVTLMAVVAMANTWAEQLTAPAATLEVIVVTASREAESRAEVSATIDVINADTIANQRPTHPKGVMNQVPGVWVSNLSGEGHSTAIRHPLTTNPVYLYLEDGIPTRSTGFFNHNALYEINVPQSGGIEVSKGPGSALYGSDAIGATVNVLTRQPPQHAEAELTVEGGEYGWGRILLSGGDAYDFNGYKTDAWRANLNLTRSDGWQDHAEYHRESFSTRWDHAGQDEGIFKNVLAVSHINQNHVGELDETEYKNDPKKNNAPISYRIVDALRLSTAYEQEQGNTLWSFTPYFRRNRMEILPNWSLSYDPSQYVTENDSFGLLSKYRIDLDALRTRLIVGLDIDYSPGSQEEDKIQTAALGSVDYSSYVVGNRIYDYDVIFHSVSPYMQVEVSPLAKLRVTAGLRYDSMGYDYDNHLDYGAISSSFTGFPASGWYGHVADSKVDYEHWSPKLGATYAFTNELNAFVALNHAFRAPSQSQVFRASRNGNAVGAQNAAEAAFRLKPVVANNLETGLRGVMNILDMSAMDYEVSVYYMSKEDDILSYRDPLTNQTTAVNAGETLHRGIEAAVGVDFWQRWRFDTSLSYAKHSYEEWLTVVNGLAIDYSGNDMEAAPRVVANTRLSYQPELMKGGRVQAEWLHLGSYWRDAANTATYEGHSLVNLRANYPIASAASNPALEVYANIDNLFDKQYAETASLSNGNNSYTAGLPRTVYVGIELKW